MGMAGYLLGVDIGTSACKLAAFHLNGEIAFQVTAAYDTFTPYVGFAEQQPEDWWHAVCRCTEQMFKTSGIRSEEILGVGVDGQSWSLIAVDQTGHVLRPAIIWLDRRSTVQCRTLVEQLGEDEILDISGNPMAPGYTTPKILWMKEHEPELYRKTHQFLQSNSYIVYKLTGALTQDVSQGYGIHAFDIQRKAWSESAAEQLGLNLELFPVIFECDAVVGEVTTQAAFESGLRPGTPVVAGGLDAACATLGVGAVVAGDVQEQGGQSGGMSIVTNHAVYDKRLICGCHVLRNRWLLQGGTVGGGSMRWFRREFAREFSDDDAFFEMINREAQAARPGSNGLLFLPYMAGERSPIWDADAKGVFIGLSYECTRGDLIRSMMEGMAFSLRHNLDTAEETSVRIELLRSMGGAAKSPLWMQIKADVTGKRMLVPHSDMASTLGAAMLAGMGVGVYKDGADAAQQSVHIRREYHPRLETSSVYEGHYQIYLETYQRLKDLFPKIGR